MMISKLPLTFAAASLLLVAACDPTGPNGNQNAQQGAAIGAVGGAVAGALIGSGGSNRERNQAALLGAALGAGTGAVIGNNLDKQAEELRRQLRNDVGVSNNGSNLVVVLSQDLLFATNSTAVSAVSQNELRIVANSGRVCSTAEWWRICRACPVNRRRSEPTDCVQRNGARASGQPSCGNHHHTELNPSQGYTKGSPLRRPFFVVTTGQSVI